MNLTFRFIFIFRLRLRLRLWLESVKTSASASASASTSTSASTSASASALAFMLIITLFMLSGCAESAATGKTSESTKIVTEEPQTSYISPSPEPSPTPAQITLNGKPIPILYYHAVDDETFGLEEMFVRQAEFDLQLKYMKDNGYEAITFNDFENNAVKTEKPFIITFDDGYMNNYTKAYPILKKYNFKAVIFLPPNFLGGGSMLTKEKVLEMRDLVSFQSHTLDHSTLTSLSPENIDFQLSESKRKIEEITGQNVNAFAYPSGMYNQQIVELASKYYKYAVLAGGGLYKYDPASHMQMIRIYIPRGLDMGTFDSKIKGYVK